MTVRRRCARWGRGCRGRAGGRAFTLLELMVVLAIILGMAALVLPLTLGDARRAALREAQEQLEAVLLSARADAQRGGWTVRVWAKESDDGWMLREEEVTPAFSMSGSEAGGERRPRPRVIQEIVLPAGVRLARTREEAEGRAPEFSQVDEEASPAEDDPESLLEGFEDAGSEEGFQVVLILPDGQIVPTRALYLGSADGRVGEVSVNSWTGVLKVRLLEPREEDEEGGELLPGEVDATEP